MPNVIIGDDVIIGAQSLVNRDCIEPGTYVGVPVRKIK
jgi:acetyltransferase-like isoleucine patch superfamily enzyme